MVTGKRDLKLHVHFRSVGCGGSVLILAHIDSWVAGGGNKHGLGVGERFATFSVIGFSFKEKIIYN